MIFFLSLIAAFTYSTVIFIDEVFQTSDFDVTTAYFKKFKISKIRLWQSVV